MPTRSDRVLHLQCLKPPRMQQLLSGSFGAGQQGLALVLGLPDPDHTLPAVTALGTPVPPSSSAASGTSTPAAPGTKPSYSSSSSSAGVSAWSATVAKAAAALEAGPAQWVKFVLSMQQELLAAIEALGRAAVAGEHLAGPSRAGSSAAAAPAPTISGLASTPAAAAVAALLQKLPEVWASVQKDAAAAEVAGVLQALFRAEFRRGYGGVTSFMRGHLHTCPNGHFFVIGECGGAMQESRCVQCGARVGGASHNLAASNRRADGAVLEELQQQWSAQWH